LLVQALGDADVIVNAARDDIDLSEIISLVDFDVDDVSSKGEHEASCSLAEEVNGLDKVIFVIYVLILGNKNRLQKRTDPRHEVVWLASEEVDLLVPVAVDVHGHFLPQLNRQRVDEDVDIFQVIVRVVLN